MNANEGRKERERNGVKNQLFFSSIVIYSSFNTINFFFLPDSVNIYKTASFFLTTIL